MTEAQFQTILKVGNEVKGKPSQGDMRDLRDAGLAIEYPDHTFCLTERGQEVLREYRIAKYKS